MILKIIDISEIMDSVLVIVVIVVIAIKLKYWSKKKSHHYYFLFIGSGQNSLHSFLKNKCKGERERAKWHGRNFLGSSGSKRDFFQNENASLRNEKKEW